MSFIALAQTFFPDQSKKTQATQDSSYSPDPLQLTNT